MVTKLISLKKDVVRLLNIELGEKASVCSQNGQVTVTISSDDFKQNFGKILLQIHRTIEEYCPRRDEHIFIIIRDSAGFHQNLIKVWRSL